MHPLICAPGGGGPDGHALIVGVANAALRSTEVVHTAAVELAVQSTNVLASLHLPDVYVDVLANAMLATMLWGDRIGHVLLLVYAHIVSTCM